MDEYSATEAAYKNGYKQGYEDALAKDNNVPSKMKATGCEYCQEDAEGYRRMIGAFSITNPFHGKVWNIETRHCKPRQIFFCPMCGRKLSEQPKEETKSSGISQRTVQALERMGQKVHGGEDE